ncbi:hypothetical protein MU1_22470 [Paenibacillus glycanilyticus]|uniref:Uncharacterized protein n=1 Tax=Paenibacillus glycanilyticus TaxID=126569 RepID=A0ABQ6GB83_9BACL|nr:hypothetical protein MU1_22470 [Paenibacillus glycanilyticus]
MPLRIKPPNNLEYTIDYVCRLASAWTSIPHIEDYLLLTR